MRIEEEATDGVKKNHSTGVKKGLGLSQQEDENNPFCTKGNNSSKQQQREKKRECIFIHMHVK